MLTSKGTTTTTIDSLNDDCLENIFRYVGGSLNDQLRVSKVCSRFQNVYLDRIWRYPILKPTDQRNRLGPVDFQNFLFGMQRKFIELDLPEINLNWFLWELTESGVDFFPYLSVCNLKNFNSVLHSSVEFNRDFQMLTKTILPNLRTLQMFTQIESSNFEHLKNLETFYLMDGETKMDLSYLKDISRQMSSLKILQIKGPMDKIYNSKERDNANEWDFPVTLQTLKLHKSVMPHVRDQLRKLHNLRRLSFLNNSAIVLPCDLALFAEILDENRRSISGVAFNNRFDCYRAVWNILREILTNEENLAMFEDLEFLCLRDFCFVRNEDISGMMKVFTNLIHLDLIGCDQVDATSLVSELNMILEKRQHKPLLIYGLDRSLNQKIPLQSSDEDLVQFSKKFPTIIGDDVLMMDFK